MKTTAQLERSLERFGESFWRRGRADRPPVGVADPAMWLPIRYLRTPSGRAELEPGEVTRERIATDYEHVFAARSIESDDMIPFAAPWRAVPWLEALCGCPVRYASGSLAPGAVVGSCAALRDVPIPARPAWLACMERQLREIANDLPPDCWVSPTILRGPSDVLAALRGLEGFLCDLYDAPEIIDGTAGRVNGLLRDVLRAHFSLVSPKMGGYGHIFGYWAPGKTTVIQEDVMGLCPPDRYRDIFLKHNQDLVDELGPHVLFHLHSTGYAHLDHVLAIEGLAGVQVTVEKNGPPLADMVPALRAVLERSRLILYVEGYVKQLKAAVGQWPATGLYLIVTSDDVRTEAEFRDLVGDLFWDGL